MIATEKKLVKRSTLDSGINYSKFQTSKFPPNQLWGAKSNPDPPTLLFPYQTLPQLGGGGSLGPQQPKTSLTHVFSWAPHSVE